MERDGAVADLHDGVGSRQEVGIEGGVVAAVERGGGEGDGAVGEGAVEFGDLHAEEAEVFAAAEFADSGGDFDGGCGCVFVVVVGEGAGGVALEVGGAGAFGFGEGGDPIAGGFGGQDGGEDGAVFGVVDQPGGVAFEGLRGGAGEGGEGDEGGLDLVAAFGAAGLGAGSGSRM